MTPWPICEVHAIMTTMKTNASAAMRIESAAIHSMPCPAPRSMPKMRKKLSTPRAAGPAPVRPFVNRRSIAAAMSSGPASWATDSRSSTTTDPTT